MKNIIEKKLPPKWPLDLLKILGISGIDIENGLIQILEGKKFNPMVWLKMMPSFPVLPNVNEYFDDSASASTKWYLPQYALKNPQEGGFGFSIIHRGFDKEGKDVYEAILLFKLNEFDPPYLTASKAKLGQNTIFSKIKLGSLNVGLNVSTTTGNIILSPEILVKNADLELKFSLKADIVKPLYNALVEGKASLNVKGQYLGVTPTSKPPVLNLFELAPQAKWIGGKMKDAKTVVEEQILPWQGDHTNSNGFVRLEHSRLEDDGVYLALTTHPRWVNNGAIKGLLPSTLINPNSKFTAKVGFLKGATMTDGVDFKVWAHFYEKKRLVSRQIVELKRKTYNGALASISADLSSFAGKELSLELRVEGGPSSGQDWAVWVAPQIESQGYELKQADFEQYVALSLPCIKYPDLYSMLRADGTSQAFGCNPPWGGTVTNNIPQYQAYNKVNLSNLGVAAVYMSNYINHQFLIVPSEYQIARDANNQPSAFCTAKVDLNSPNQCIANLDFGLAPAIDGFALCQIKKAIIQSWALEDISKTISLVFPDNPMQIEWDKTLIPRAQLLNDGNYLFGVGNQFFLSLQGLGLLNAELIARSISGENPPGQRFPFKVRLAGQPAPVNCAIELSLNKLSGELLTLPPRTGVAKQLTIQNPLNMDLYIGEVLSETLDRTSNNLYKLDRTLPANSSISFELNAADQGAQFAVQASEIVANPYALRDTTVSNDEIQQEIVIALSESIFTQAPVEFVEVKLQMKGAAAKASKTFNSVKELNQKAMVSLPLGFYLSKRELEYVAIVRFNGKDEKGKDEKIVVGALNLREGALLNLSKSSLGLP